MGVQSRLDRAIGWANARLRREYAAPQSPRTVAQCTCRGMSQSCGAKLLVSLVLVSCIVLVAMTFDISNLEGWLMWVKENKLQGSLLFLLLYTLAIVLMAPAMVMAMCAGAIFGVLAGALVVWVGSSVGQVLAFMVGRYLLRDFVVAFLSSQYPKWGAVDKALEREGWKLVTLLRLSPICPWNVLNYALAATAVPLGAYALASSLAVLPYLVLFVYMGSLARTLSDIFSGLAGPDTGTTIALAAVSGVLLVALVWYTTQMAKRAIKEALVDESDATVAEGTEVDVLCMLRGDPDSAGLCSEEHSRASMHGSPRRTSIELAPAGGGVEGFVGEAHPRHHPQPAWSPTARHSMHSVHHHHTHHAGQHHGGGVAATVRVVGGSLSASGTPTVAGTGGGGVGHAGGGRHHRHSPDHEVHIIPLLPKKDTGPSVGSTPRDLEGGGGGEAVGEGLQHHARGSAAKLLTPRTALAAAR